MSKKPANLPSSTSFLSYQKGSADFILTLFAMAALCLMAIHIIHLVESGNNLRDPRFSSGPLGERFHEIYLSEYQQYTTGDDHQGDQWTLLSLSPDGIHYTYRNKTHKIFSGSSNVSRTYGQSEYFTLVLSNDSTCPLDLIRSTITSLPMDSTNSQYCVFLSRDVSTMSHEEAFRYWIKMKDNIRTGLSNAHDVVSEHVRF